MIAPRTFPTANDVADHYDDLDVFYREVWGEHVHHGLWQTGKETPDVAVRQLVDRIAAEARLRPGDHVCDVGAGYGATARQLARTHDVHVTALTISPAQYQYACSVEPVSSNPSYLLRDWLRNDLPAGSFDTVVAIESLSHMTDKPAFFREAARVLRPQGRLVVCAWLATPLPTPWEVRLLLEPICREGRLPGLGNAAEYTTLMVEAGFTLDRFEDLSTQVSPTWTYCLRRITRRLARDARYRRYLLNASSHNRIFLLTLLRLWAAYRTGTFRYGLFTAVRDNSDPAGH